MSVIELWDIVGGGDICECRSEVRRATVHRRHIFTLVYTLYCCTFINYVDIDMRPRTRLSLE